MCPPPPSFLTAVLGCPISTRVLGGEMWDSAGVHFTRLLLQHDFAGFQGGALIANLTQ